MTSYFPYPHPTTTSYPAPPEPPRRRLGTGLVAVTAAVALLAGGAGAALGVSLADGPASVTTAGGTTTQTVLSPSDEDTVASVAAAVTPSVVTINVRGASAAGSGSGVILTSDGTILTNNHVVAAARGGSITVEFSDGTQAAATVVGTDPSTDIAVIQAENVSGLRAASFADSDEVVVGELVIAIGSPLGLDGTVTSGVVSAVDRPVRTGDTDSQAVIDAIQTDAAINPGNSGGALLDADGNVIGINSAIATVSDASAGNIGVGFAIPSNTARQVAAQLIQNGVAIHAQLGVEAGNYADEQTAGAQLRTVTSGGAADAAGLQAGDVIVAVDGRPTENVDTLIVAIRSHGPGDEVTITYLRDGEELTTTATLTPAGTS
ncbi:MAG: trypsin-like peptidase domain-containing protein [Geodermatophilaceae bacterium]|nr:trypsin-like peptidase domain-containing protein [Geodermatophilaceae bacterium]MDQ3454086.1 trypsin-like peptidase domain-containing protein [Actinomycetota bacterium]